MTEKSINISESWLILAHCFNLDGRAASQTITDRLPFIMKNGVRPVVVSALHSIKDHRFPHYRVVSPAPSGVLFEFRYIINQTIDGVKLRHLLKAFLLLFCLPFLVIEKMIVQLDSHWSWAISGAIVGSCVMRKHKPTLIYSTAGPSSTHWAGYLLSLFTKRPWIAELHDPLVYDGNTRKGQRHLFDLWLERLIFRRASAIIYFSDIALKSAEKRNRRRGKGYVLRPGANPPDFSKVRYRKRQRIHFGHFGSLAKGRNLSFLLEGFHAVLEERPSWRDILSIDIYGGKLDPISQRSVRKHSLDDIVKEHGRLEYDQVTGKSGRQRVLEAMCRCDILLLIHGEGTVCQEYIPSKLYEYLLTGRPILAFVSKYSELREILQKEKHLIVDTTSKTAVRDRLANMILMWQSDELPEFTPTSSYSVESTVNQLFAIRTKTC